MIVLSKVGSGAPTLGEAGAPEEVRRAIASDNAEFIALQRAYTARADIAELRVMIEGGDFATIHLLKADTLQDATTRAADALGVDLSAGRRARLRLYDEREGRPTRTYGGRESESLASLGLISGGAMLLETREPGDGSDFSEFNPDAMFVELAPWDDVSKSHGESVELAVEGERMATAGHLVKAIAEHLDVPPASFFAVSATEGRVVQDDDARLLGRDYNIGKGDIIIWEKRDVSDGEDEEHLRAATAAERRCDRYGAKSNFD